MGSAGTSVVPVGQAHGERQKFCPRITSTFLTWAGDKDGVVWVPGEEIRPTNILGHV